MDRSCPGLPRPFYQIVVTYFRLTWDVHVLLGSIRSCLPWWSDVSEAGRFSAGFGSVWFALFSRWIGFDSHSFFVNLSVSFSYVFPGCFFSSHVNPQYQCGFVGIAIKFQLTDVPISTMIHQSFRSFNAASFINQTKPKYEGERPTTPYHVTNLARSSERYYPFNLYQLVC